MEELEKTDWCNNCGKPVDPHQETCSNCEKLHNTIEGLPHTVMTPDRKRQRLMENRFRFLLNDDEGPTEDTSSYPNLLLYHPQKVYEQIYAKKDLLELVWDLLPRAIGLLFIFSLCQINSIFSLDSLTALVKVPLIVIGTFAFSLPILHHLNLALGLMINFRQSLAILSTALYTTSILLASFGVVQLVIKFCATPPISALFFTLFLFASIIFGLFKIQKIYGYITTKSERVFNKLFIPCFAFLAIILTLNLLVALNPYTIEESFQNLPTSAVSDTILNVTGTLGGR